MQFKLKSPFICGQVVCKSMRGASLGTAEVTCDVSRVTCTGVGTHSVLTPSSVAPALGQGWVRTEPGHPPSPAQPEQHAASSSCWSARAGLGWAGQLGPVTAAAVMIYCHASPLAFLLFSPPTTSEQLHLLNSHLSDRGDLQTYILHFTLQKHFRLL